MRRLFSAVCAFLGLSGASHASPPVQMLDPKTILFSVPTLSHDIAELLPGPTKAAQDDLVFHEDDWTQVEFLPRAILPEIQAMMKEFKAFELANRVQHGWKNVYVRKVPRGLLFREPKALHSLAKILGIEPGPAPILFSTSTTGCRVKNGFSFTLGGNIALYGFQSQDGIMVLGANVGQNPSDIILTRTFAKLCVSSDLVLVDWRAQMILVSVKSDGQIDVWCP